jgi:hypothetical protein
MRWLPLPRRLLLLRHPGRASLELPGRLVLVPAAQGWRQVWLVVDLGQYWAERVAPA